MNYMELSDLTVTKYLREFMIQRKLAENTSKLDALFTIFPFRLLLECDGVNYELMAYLSDILCILIKSNEYLNNFRNSIDMTVDFALRNLVFLTKTKNNEKVLMKLIILLYEICNRLFNSNGNATIIVKVDRICHVLLMFFQSTCPLDVKLYGTKILTIILTNRNLNNNCKLLKNCIEEMFNNVNPTQENTDLFKIFLLAVKACWNLSDFFALFAWMEAIYPQYMHTDTDVITLGYVIDSLIICYEKRNQLNDFISRLNVTLTNNLPNICDIIKHSNEIKEKSETLLYHLIMENCMLLNLLWYGGSENLRYEIKQLRQYDNWCDSQSDLFFFIAYLECLNNKLQWSHIDILKSIHERIKLSTFISPICLKSICLLYGVFHLEKINKSKITKCYLLRQLTIYKNLITYHPYQLKWILKDGSLELKLEVLRMWLERDDSYLLNIFQNGDDIKYLVDYILTKNNDNSEISQRAIEILQTFKSENLSKYIMKSIMLKATHLPEIVGLLLQTKPFVPNDKDLCLHLIGYLGNLMPIIENSTSIQYTCLFVKNSIITYKQDSNFLLTFSNAPFIINFLTTLCYQEKDDISVSAIKLLKTLVRLQGRHKMSISKTHYVDFNPMLYGTKYKLREVLDLLFLVLKPRAEVPVLTINEASYLELYQNLHNLSFQNISLNTFLCLSYLLNSREYLAYSTTTIILIRKYCLEITKMSLMPFLDFLKIWLMKIGRMAFFTIPYDELYAFLSVIPSNRKVKEVLNLMSSSYEN